MSLVEEVEAKIRELEDTQSYLPIKGFLWFEIEHQLDLFRRILNDIKGEN